MIDLIEFLKVPTNQAFVLVGAFLFMQFVGEVLEFKGKIVPEFLKVRKYFARKKKEHEVLAKMPDIIAKFENLPDVAQTLSDVQRTLSEVNEHYSRDNITMRDKWMESVDRRFCESDRWMKTLDQKLDQNNADTLSIKIDNMRNTIIGFSQYVSIESNPVTREQYTRVFKLHSKYEETITENGMTNGEVDIAFRIITESYEQHLRNRTFIEDVRGYNVPM